MRSLTLHSGLMFSSLASDGRHAAFGHLPKLDQRRVADALGDVVVNLRGGHGCSSGLVGEAATDHARALAAKYNRTFAAVGSTLAGKKYDEPGR